MVKDFWYEVFKFDLAKNEPISLFTDKDLEKCLKVYRKAKLGDKSVKLGKWVHFSHIGEPMLYSSLLN